ncbi:hypothetical protein C8R47DRAFT_1031643 [Mycena vitilis]|nr:hypothetical protein C8R47DRAFT_1031643 [Mycena vitilis]
MLLRRLGAASLQSTAFPSLYEGDVLTATLSLSGSVVVGSSCDTVAKIPPVCGGWGKVRHCRLRRSACRELTRQQPISSQNSVPKLEMGGIRGFGPIFARLALSPHHPTAMDDAQLLASITAGALLEFRASQFPPAFIAANPAVFLNLDWVHPAQLRAFMESRQPFTLTASTRPVKVEAFDASVSIRPDSRVKSEGSIVDLSSDPSSPPPHLSRAPVRTRQILDNDVDVIEILSSDDELEVEVSLRPSGASSDPPSASDYDAPSKDSDSDDDDIEGSAVETLSTTEWFDPDIIARAIDGLAHINRQTKVQRVEYLNSIPSYFPVFREPTAVILDLRDPKFDFYDDDGELLRADALILDKNQESFRNSGGGGDQQPTCLLFNGKAVKCRRSRNTCNGCFRCSELDLSLVNVTRFELDLSSRAQVISAEIATRMKEGDSPEKLVAAFYRVITSANRKCTVKDQIGAPCVGHPIMKARVNSLQHPWFISCSEWTPTWRGHRTDSIPDNVNPTLLAELMSPKAAFSSVSQTEPCSRIISARVGERQKFCAHVHLAQGQSVRGTMIHHACTAYMTIYVPVDTSLRMACVVFDPAKPHSHPMPPMTKVSLDAKESYRRCVRAAGILGTTVQKVDDAPTTLLLLKGQSPAMFHPSLHTKRLKQGIIRDEKLKASPEGLGVAGIYARHLKDLDLPPEQRYIQSVTTTPQGRILIITMVPYLAHLVHLARTIQVDTTFGRTLGDLNEWEFVIWYGSVERVVTAGRVYTNGADRDFYKCLFDELQVIIFRLTGKQLRFKRFTPGGNLLTMGVDMEAAQVGGACDSLLSTNDPEYSGITTTDPDEFATFFVRACISHSKRGVHALKPYVTPDVLARLMEFPYLKTKDDVDQFTAWIAALKIKKVQDWWKHKLQYPWIIPSLVKSQSRIHAADWDITDSSTNLNEGQHHWTNQRTGTKLTPLEALESARKVDFKTAREVKDSLETGILDNNSNNVVHRMGRKVQRAANAAEKARAAGEQRTETAELQAQLDATKAAKKLADQNLKEAQAKLTAAKGPTRRRRGAAATLGADRPLEATSSGRVLSPRRARARVPSLESMPPTDATASTSIPIHSALSLPFILPTAAPLPDSALPFDDDFSWLTVPPVAGAQPDYSLFPDTQYSLPQISAVQPDYSMFSQTRYSADADAPYSFGFQNTDFDFFPSSDTHFSGDSSAVSISDLSGFPTTTAAGDWDMAAAGINFFDPYTIYADGPYTDVGSQQQIGVSELPLLPPARPSPQPVSSVEEPHSSAVQPRSVSPEISAPSPIQHLNADFDQRNIITTARRRAPPKRVLGSVVDADTDVLPRAKKLRSRR